MDDSLSDLKVQTEIPRRYLSHVLMAHILTKVRNLATQYLMMIILTIPLVNCLKTNHHRLNKFGFNNNLFIKIKKMLCCDAHYNKYFLNNCYKNNTVQNGFSESLEKKILFLFYCPLSTVDF